MYEFRMEEHFWTQEALITHIDFNRFSSIGGLVNIFFELV